MKTCIHHAVEILRWQGLAVPEFQLRRAYWRQIRQGFGGTSFELRGFAMAEYIKINKLF
jgi:hypothetical protein